jgi:hypothetical protein
MMYRPACPAKSHKRPKTGAGTLRPQAMKKMPINIGTSIHHRRRDRNSNSLKIASWS